MWQAVLSMDGPTVLSVAVKALAYLASLTAAGSALSLICFTTLDGDTTQVVRRLGLASTCVAVLASIALVPMGAIFLAGESWAGAIDPVLARMVAESPIGESLMVLIAGLALVSLLFIGGRTARFAAVLGTVMVCASFAFRGHVLAEPRFVLGALLTAHLLGLAFWIGAFVPLYRLALHADPAHAGAAADEFGRKALWVIASLALAGAGLLVILTANPLDALTTPYGQLLALKLSIFVLLLCVAAFNKLRLTPALLAGDAGAGARLRRSIGLELAAVCAILVMTAVLTIVASPKAPA